MNIVEYIQFDAFNSKRLGLYLVERSAPTPEEKELIETLPFMQGSLDFSNILGERAFNNRPITYEFISGTLNYGARKDLERRIKQLTMLKNEVKLFDTHDPEFYWIGKCKSVNVVDDHRKQRLNITLVFDCYPFMIDRRNTFNDIWDEFGFDSDTSSWTKYPINGERIIVIGNSGNTTISPTFIASSSMKLVYEGRVIDLIEGETSSPYIQMRPFVETRFIVYGKGMLQIRWNKEVMG